MQQELKNKIIKLLKETRKAITYYEPSTSAAKTGANCIALDKGVILKTWCNGCNIVFVFKDNQKVGKIEDFKDKLHGLRLAAEERIQKEIIENL